MYIFSMCNGLGVGSWVFEFMIIVFSGEVDVFGVGDGDVCFIIWMVLESGIYLIVINEVGSCGGGDNIVISNGFFVLICIGGFEVVCFVIFCVVGELAIIGEIVVCGLEGIFIIEIDGIDIIFEIGGFGW